MKTVRKIVLMALGTGLFLLGAGCFSTSPVPEYYSLNMSASGQVEPVRYNLRVGRLTVTEALERRNILVRTHQTRAEYYAREQWLSSLKEQVAQKLAAEFGEAVPGLPTLTVSGCIMAFEQLDLPDGRAAGHVKLRLALRKEGMDRYEKPLCEKVYETTEPAVDASANAAVDALSRGLIRVAQAIVADGETL